jgi:protein SCO1/2
MAGVNRRAQLAGIAISILTCTATLAQEPPKVDTNVIGIDQKIGSQAPLDINLTDWNGRPVQLADAMSERPAILMLIFYRCAGYCTMEMDGLLKGIRALKKLNVGRDFDVISVSIHPKERPDEAAKNRSSALERYGRLGAEAGWQSLVGEESEVRRLASAVGFRYTYEEKGDQVVHPAGIMVLTPQGKVSQYLFGTDYPATALAIALRDAGAGKMGAVVAKPVLLGCLQYDPRTGTLRLQVMRTLQVAGVGTVLILLGSIVFMNRKYRRTALRPTDVAVARGDAVQNG